MTPEQHDRIRRIERVQRAHTVVLVVLLILTLASLARGNPVQLAATDRQNLPRIDWGYYYYVSLRHLPDDDRQHYADVLYFVLASTSQQQIVERIIPHRVADGLYRLDLRDLLWDVRQWQQVVVRYPYSDRPLPLVLAGDWLIQEITDTSRSDAYYRLLYGTTDLDRDAFFRAWQVNDSDEQFAIGWLEGSSRVAIERTRVLKSFAVGSRTYHWGTEDSAEVIGVADPLEQLDRRKLKHEAEEHIVGMPKRSIRTGEFGAMQAYLLSDSDGTRQEEAPPDIVSDGTGVRGRRDIRNVISCISCHVEGLRPPARDLYRQYMSLGATHYSDRETLDRIKLFYGAPVEAQLERDRELYAAGLQLVNGLSPAENAGQYVWAVESYDLDLTPERAAAELHVDAEALQNALAYYASIGYHLGARLAMLSEGGTIPRRAWEAQYLTAREAVRRWREK